MVEQLRKKRAEEGGFTLIELLIVIIILGILAAIVVFAVGNTRKDSVANSCKTDFKSVELSAEAVMTKKGAMPATSTVFSGTAPVADAHNALAAGADDGASPAVAFDNGALLKAYPAPADYRIGYAQAGSGTGYQLTGMKKSGASFAAVATDSHASGGCENL